MKKGLIQNKKMLETTVLRKDALSILAAGMDALDTDLVLRTKVSLSKEVLKVGRRKYKLSKYNRIFVLGIGKSSLGAAKTLENILGSKITDGVILDVKKGSLKYMKSIAGTHPYPSDKNIRATGEMLGILKGLDSKDLLISIISGGGSALMCWPYQLECTDVVAITRLLMKRGAEIHELNTVRKHLSEIQGGQLARLAHPATVVGLIFSDVPGDDISMVASGPTVLDTTTVADAERVLKKYDVIKECNLGECNLKETPKDPSLFSHVHNELVVTNKVALKAMQAKARVLGYRSSIFSARVDGEAKNVGELLAKLPKKGQVIIAGGETTVTVTHPGKGGRNLEVALGALKTVHEDGLVLSFASDGIDNTPIAGGLADQTTKERAARLGFDSETFLEKNQSYDFFLKTKSHIRTGVTGVNVSDLMISMRAK